MKKYSVMHNVLWNIFNIQLFMIKKWNKHLKPFTFKQYYFDVMLKI